MNRSRAFCLVFLFAVVGSCALPCVGAPPNKALETEDEAALLKAAKTAELHGIAIYHPTEYGLNGKSVKEWSKLVTSIRDAKGAVAYIRKFMPEDILKGAAKEGMIEKFAELRIPFEARVMQLSFVHWFDDVLDERDFYNEKAFADVKLDDETKRLISYGDKRTVFQTAQLNWRLMTAVFPDSIPDLPPQYRTVRVVVRDDKQVVLVLSCSAVCHWAIDVKPGSEVTGVILCGCLGQEIELIENPKKPPIVYRALHGPDGNRVLKSNEYLDGHELGSLPSDKFRIRDRFEGGIKKLTGKEGFVSMQREYEPKASSYTIPPKK